jgi:hypothetical protein
MSASDKAKLDGIASGAQVNAVTSVAGRTGAITLANSDVSGSAPLANPALSGIPTAPTAEVGTNTTQIATTAFVMANGGGSKYYTSTLSNASGAQAFTIENGVANKVSFSYGAPLTSAQVAAINTMGDVYISSVSDTSVSIYKSTAPGISTIPIVIIVRI